MERLLRPQVFDTDPSNQDSAKLWPNFKRTFENFKNVIQTDDETDMENLNL